MFPCISLEASFDCTHAIIAEKYFDYWAGGRQEMDGLLGNHISAIVKMSYTPNNFRPYFFRVSVCCKRRVAARVWNPFSVIQKSFQILDKIVETQKTMQEGQEEIRKDIKSVKSGLARLDSGLARLETKIGRGQQGGPASGGASASGSLPKTWGWVLGAQTGSQPGGRDHLPTCGCHQGTWPDVTGVS